MSAPAEDGHPPAGEGPHPLIVKAAAVMRRFAAVSDSENQALAEAALVRSRFTEALVAALKRQSAAEAQLRPLAALAQAAVADWTGLGMARRLTWKLRAVLARAGLPGQALLLAASGLWRTRGRLDLDFLRAAGYLRRRAEPAVRPDSLYDPAWYLEQNPDLATARLAPILHYLLRGQFEGRSPHPLFDADWYARRNAGSLAASRLWPLAHFMRVGAWTGRSPHPFFDMGHYAAQAPALAPGEDFPSHYLREGWKQGLSPHPLFDPAWYVAQVPAAEAGIPPLEHFIRKGEAAGLSPHPLFDPAWYLAQAPEAAAAGTGALRHYLEVGAARRLSPSRWFDSPHYVVRRGDSLPPSADPLVDYLQGGAWIVAEPFPGFASAAYLATQPELVAEGLTPLEHWARRAAADRPRTIDRTRRA